MPSSPSLHTHIELCRWRFWKSSSFNAFMGPSCGMLPTPQDLMPKTYKSWLEINWTLGGFYFLNFPLASDWRWSHSTWAFAWTRGIAFWSFCHWIACASLKMHAFIRAWSWQCRPFSQVKGQPNLPFFTMRSCIFLRC